MPEIKQPEQLSLDLDNNTRLFINLEKLRNDLAMYDFNVLAFDAALVAGAPQPLGRPGQRVIPVPALHRYLPGGIVEIYAGAQPENP